MKAINDDLKSTEKSGKSEKSEIPSGKTSIPHKMVFERKVDTLSQVAHFKARLWLQRDFSKQIVEYTETFSAVVHWYGLKQSLKLWSEKTAQSLSDLWSKQLSTGDCVFTLNRRSQTTIIFSLRRRFNYPRAWFEKRRLG